MSAPKSVIKFKKDGISYESFSEQSQYYLHELTRAALRDVGTFLKKTFRREYYNHFKKRTGYSLKAVRSTVYSNAKTEHPRLDIGLQVNPKTGKIGSGFNAFFQEFGSRNPDVPKLGLLQGAAMNNIAEIVKIESTYLTALNDEARRLNELIDENEDRGEKE